MICYRCKYYEKEDYDNDTGASNPAGCDYVVEKLDGVDCNGSGTGNAIEQIGIMLENILFTISDKFNECPFFKDKQRMPSILDRKL